MQPPLWLYQWLEVKTRRKIRKDAQPLRGPGRTWWNLAVWRYLYPGLWVKTFSKLLGNCRNVFVSLVCFYGSGHRVIVLVAKLRPTLCDPMDCNPPGSSVHGPSPEDLPDPGIKPTSALWADSLPLSHQGSILGS